jgi:hypothetical protein
MQVRIVIFPSDDGLNVVVWGHWAQGSMRVRHFDSRSSMISTLENLRLIAPKDVPDLENYTFLDSCPLFSSEIDEEILTAHGFHSA